MVEFEVNEPATNPLVFHKSPNEEILFCPSGLSKKICENRDCFNKWIIILADLGFFKHSTGVEWVEISQKIFVPFFGPRMFLRS